MILTPLQHTPATPLPLPPTPAMVPETCVPWSSLAPPELMLLLPPSKSQPRVSSTLPLPSLSTPSAGSYGLTHMLAARSSWLKYTPSSITPTTTLPQSVWPAPQASAACEPYWLAGADASPYMPHSEPLVE